MGLAYLPPRAEY